MPNNVIQSLVSGLFIPLPFAKRSGHFFSTWHYFCIYQSKAEKKPMDQFAFGFLKFKFSPCKIPVKLYN